MTTAEFLSALRDRDVRLRAENGRLKCSAPPGVLSAEMKAALTSRKDELLAILEHAESVRSGPRAIVPLKAGGSRPPIFGIPGHNGDVFCFVSVTRHLDPDQPLVGVQPPGLDGSEPLRSIEELAAYEAEQIQRYHAQGPYILAGYCAGGTIAFEVARQLNEQGHDVALVALLGSSFPRTYRWAPRARLRLRRLGARAMHQLHLLRSSSITDGMRYIRTTLRQRTEQHVAPVGELHRRVMESRQRVERATIAALGHYELRPYPGEIHVFLPSEEWRKQGGRPDQWRTVASAVREHVGPDDCPSDAMLLEPYVSGVAGALCARLDEIAARSGARTSRKGPGTISQGAG